MATWPLSIAVLGVATLGMIVDHHRLICGSSTVGIGSHAYLGASPGAMAQVVALTAG